MPTYVIEREIPGASQWTEDQIRESSQKSLDLLQRLGVQWMHSYVTDDKVYCVYWAPNEDVIKTHGETLGIPVDRVSAVRRLLGPQSTE
jgi:hypothetical protein